MSVSFVAHQLSYVGLAEHVLASSRDVNAYVSQSMHAHKDSTPLRKAVQPAKAKAELLPLYGAWWL